MEHLCRRLLTMVKRLGGHSAAFVCHICHGQPSPLGYFPLTSMLRLILVSDFSSPRIERPYHWRCLFKHFSMMNITLHRSIVTIPCYAIDATQHFRLHYGEVAFIVFGGGLVIRIMLRMVSDSRCSLIRRSRKSSVVKRQVADAIS